MAQEDVTLLFQEINSFLTRQIFMNNKNLLKNIEVKSMTINLLLLLTLGRGKVWKVYGQKHQSTSILWPQQSNFN